MDDYIRVTYALELSSPPELATLGAVAAAMARNGSYGTWTEDLYGGDLFDLSEIRQRAGAKVEQVDDDTGTAVIAFPEANFDLDMGHLTQVLGTVAGDILGHSSIRAAKIINIEFPQQWMAGFDGPAVGVEGLKQLTEIKNRPLVAFSVKPRSGLTPDEFAKLVTAVAVGHNGTGVDIIEDDERLLNRAYCPLEERVRAVRRALDSAGSQKVYSANISGRPERILDLAKTAVDAGANGLKVDV